MEVMEEVEGTLMMEVREKLTEKLKGALLEARMSGFR